MSKKLLLIMLFCVTLWADRSGPYIGIGAGLAIYDDGNRLASIEDKSDEAYRIYAGAYINEYFSVEIDYTAGMRFEGVSVLGGDVVDTFSVFSIAALAHYPLEKYGVDFYGKFGAGQLQWKESGIAGSSSNAGTILFGAGMGYRFGEQFTFNVGYDYYAFKMEVLIQNYRMSLGMPYVKFEMQF